MTTARLLVGVAGLSLLVYGAGAQLSQAQEAAPQAAPAAPSCSGLGCIFGSRPQTQAQPSAAEAQALQANEAAARADAAAGADPAKGGAKVAEKRKPAKAAVHVVTIAADGPEAARLKTLAAAMPKEKIKIVAAAKGEGDKASSDFTVSTALEPNQAEKARLFTEQMHIVAASGVQKIADLEGKVVSFGPDKTPGQAAARKAFEALNVRVEETPLDVDNALDGLSTGDVQAVVILAPQPVDKLKSVSAPGVHLVSWPESGSLPDGAVASTIDGGAYPGLAKPGETIKAMGVDATLNISAKGAKQTAAKSFLKALSQNSEALTKRGFDLLKADLDSRKGRRLASAGRPLN